MSSPADPAPPASADQSADEPTAAASLVARMRAGERRAIAEAAT
jgi:hypothetical protein